MKHETSHYPDRWADVNARINIAGALILIALVLLVIAYKLTA